MPMDSESENIKDYLSSNEVPELFYEDLLDDLDIRCDYDWSVSLIDAISLTVRSGPIFECFWLGLL